MSPRTSTEISSSGPLQTPTSAGADEVFLSPRVVDRRAFNDLSAELRKLVERAASERAALGSSLDQAGEAIKVIRNGEAAQQGNLELTAKALKRLDERMGKAQQLLDQAGSINELVAKFDGSADALITRKIDAFEARLESAQATVAARVESLEERLRGATRDLEQRISTLRQDAEGLVGPGLEAVNLAVAHHESLLGRRPGMHSEGPATPGSLGDVVERAESVGSTAEIAVQRFESAQALASQHFETARRLGEEMSILAGRMDEQRATMAAALDRAERQVADADAQIHATIERAGRSAHDAIAEIKPQAEAATARAGQTVSELAGLIRQAEDTHNTTSLVLRLADQRHTQLGETLKALEPWRGLLVDSRAGADLPPPIRALIEAVRRELAQDLGRIAEALGGAARNAQRAAAAVNAMPAVEIAGSAYRDAAIPSVLVQPLDPRVALTDAHGAD